MKKVLAILLTTFLVVSPAFAFSWISTAKKTLPSIVQLMTLDGKGFCSGFVLDNERDFVYTDSHCVHNKWTVDGFTVDGLEAEVVVESPYQTGLDWAILHVKGIDKPELRPDFNPLEVGTLVAALGFGYGNRDFNFLSGAVSNPNKSYPDWGEHGQWVELNFSVIGGMSGGPVVNEKGRVVSVVQKGTDQISLGRSIGMIWLGTREYWKH